MGNYVSCTLLAKAPGAGRCARVIMPDGVVRRVTLPATAAELMMDAPGHFFADARRVGARLAALAADDDLELGGAYAAFPKKRLGTPIAAADAARLAAAATIREARRSAKVANVVAASAVGAAAEDATPRLRLEEMVDDAAAAEIGALKHRLSNARSRKPTLDTIQEENYLSSRAA